MPTPEGFLEIWFKIIYVGDPEPMFTMLGYSNLGTVTQAAVNAGFAQANTVLAGEYSGGVTLDGGHVVQAGTGGGVRTDSEVTPVSGSNSASMSVQNTAVLVSKLTGGGGRRNKGRMYWPGPVETGVDGIGVLTTATRAAWQANVDALMPGGSIYTAFGFLADPVLFHETGSQTPTVIDALGVQARVATQRRRLRR